MTATTTRPVPQPPGPRSTPMIVAQMRAARLNEVDAALSHRLDRVRRRSSQELDTALMELRDAAQAHRLLCPLTDAVVLEDDDQTRMRAVKLRLDNAVIRAVAAGASTAQIDELTRGVLR